MTTFYGDIVPEIPTHPGPTHDRFLSVRLDEAINFGGRVEREINTMREGFGEFVMRARTVFGQPMLAVGFRGDVRLVAWSKVIQAQPHPDMTYLEGPVNYPEGWVEPLAPQLMMDHAIRERKRYEADCRAAASGLGAQHAATLVSSAGEITQVFSSENVPPGMALVPLEEALCQQVDKPAKRRGRPPKVRT